MIKREFTFGDEDTCKQKWTFTLSSGDEGWIIDDLQIDDRPAPRGCSGHPKTIVALVKGRMVGSIDVETLAEAACGRSLSCGQVLARCLREIAAD